jgi:hypothetical protein
MFSPVYTSWVWLQGSSEGGNSGSSNYPFSRTFFSSATVSPSTVTFFGADRAGIYGANQAYSDVWRLQFSVVNCSLGQLLNSSSGLCFNCPSGSFHNLSIGNCSLCSGGFFSLSGSSRCTNCLPGTYSSAFGASYCNNCPIGFFTSKSGSTACQACATGKYAATLGASVCLQCPEGSFSNQNGGTYCQSCSPGFFSASAAILCSNCAVGLFAELNESSSCSLCQSGRFSSQTARSSCIFCVEGKYQGNSGATFCASCPKGRYSPDPGLESCIQCENSTTLSIGSISKEACSICDEGFFGSPIQSCLPCILSNAVTCPLGCKIPLISSGYFRAGPSGREATIALKCIPQEACKYTYNLSSTLCESGYTGFLCGACDESYYRLDVNCKSCPSVYVKWATVSVFILVLLFVMLRVVHKSSSLTADVRITVQAIQLISLFPSITTKWPKQVLVLMQIYSVMVNHSNATL